VSQSLSLETHLINRQQYLAQFLLVILGVGVPLDIHAQEKPPKPVLKEPSKNPASLTKAVKLESKSSPSRQERALRNPKVRILW